MLWSEIKSRETRTKQSLKLVKFIQDHIDHYLRKEASRPFIPSFVNSLPSILLLE